MSDEHNEHEHNEHEHEHEAPLLAPVEPTSEYGYWKSIRELSGEATFQTDRSGKEFSSEPSRVIDPMHRRNFMQLMGASMGLAGVGLAGCRYEKEDIVPLARRPEDQTPGATLQYATAYELGGVGYALVATSYEGRPIKVDGNPEHPYSNGAIVNVSDESSSGKSQLNPRAATSAFVQGSILHLYDPDRSQAPTSKGTGTSLDAVKAALAEMMKNPAGLRILSEATTSPTIGILKNELKGVQWHEYEAVSWDNERAGMKLAFGTSVRPMAKLDQCKTIVTIDCDIFLDHPHSLRYSRDWAKSRRQKGSTLGNGMMNRLWSVESTLSNTGAMADHRLALRSEFGLPFVLALEAKLGKGTAPQAKFLGENRVDPFLTVLAEELNENKGKAVLIAGRRQPAEVHAVVARINQAIGAVGSVLDYVADIEPNRPTHVESIGQLVKDIKDKKVQTLLIFGGNPVYDAPAELDFAAAMAGVQTTLHLSEYDNETSKKSTWHVPKAHYLEAWGDIRTPDGTITIAQPLIAPLFGGVSIAEMLAMLANIDKAGSDLVKWVHEDKLNVAGNWRANVEAGFVQGSTLPIQNVTLASFPAPQLTESQRGSSARSKDDYEVTFAVSSFTYDGRFANNAWLWETPDFLTKVTWDNFALVSQASGLPNDTKIEVKVNGKSIVLPAYTIPGQAHSSITLVLGGGRTQAGRVGGDGDHDSVGWDTHKVRTSTGFDIALKASAASTGDKYELASIQEHWDIRTGIVHSVTQEGIAKRIPELIRETTNDNLKKDPKWVAEEAEGFWNDHNTNGKPRGLSLFEEKAYGGHRWGMAIDLSTCMGCNACMVACQAENNVPVVGRQEVMNNREMSWIRIDRYFKGTVDEPEVVHQPVGCQHCEMAPCEAVCPVGATQHSDEGLNDMAYNRCIGTRYCANNCPYKVRRFNFLDWNKEWRDARNKVRRLLFNPDVTVRMRGVMEKCSFCVQRIQNAKIKAKAEIRNNTRQGVINGPLRDGEVTTACQDVCPTEAIVFGDLSDKTSRVSRLHEDRRSYALLPELYTKPRNRFLARVRNPNPKLVSSAPSAAKEGGHE